MSRSPYSIQKVAVLGAGVMGSQIAAHCVNAGLEVLLLDLKSDDSSRPDKNAEESLKKISGMKPPPFALADYARRVRTGNFEDDFDLLADVDWICEVIIEKMDAKQQMMLQIDKVRKETCIVSSNTSGLPISEISKNCSSSFKAHFLGTHFFNPPRYMKLLEIIPTQNTHSDVASYMQGFCEKTLGKGVVISNDTPNFVANRIGVFSMANIMPYFFNRDFRAEEIDFLLGSLTGYSKAGTFRTADMAGLDVIYHVAKNLYPAIPDDEMREVFRLPGQFQKMVAEGNIGNKAGAGFYKKERTKKGTEYLVINPHSLEYESQRKSENPVINEALHIENTPERLKFLAEAGGKIGDFIWKTQRDLLLYAANRIPEVSDSPLAIDRAMKWGFNWEMGPFERWDALGVEYVVTRITEEGYEIPAVVKKILEAGITTFYENGKIFDPPTAKRMESTPAADGEIKVEYLKRVNLPVHGNESAALHDLGDGVALFEFKTNNTTLGYELVKTLENSLDVVKSKFKALVISHDGEDFAFGANLKEAIEAVKSQNRTQIEEAVENFQRTAVALKYAPFPVVTAPFGRTLGGGLEFCLYSDKVVAHHELYAGLVEAGVGLIPAGGGTTEMLRRAMQCAKGEADPIPFLREAFKILGMAQVSDSAARAKEMGFLRSSDVIVMNRDLLIKRAKNEALNLVNAGYQPPAKTPIPVQGKKILAVLKVMLYITRESGFISDYDKIIGERLAYVLSGGSLSEPQEVPEDYLLKLEREAILECFNDERTIARLEQKLK